jgi:hypothetical protein
VSETIVSEAADTSSVTSESISLKQIQVGAELELVNESSIIGEERIQDSGYILGKGSAMKFNGVVASYEYSMNQSSVAVLFDINAVGSGRLVLYDGTREISIGSDVSRYQLSTEGSAVAFKTKSSSSEEVGTLSYYTDRSGSISTISEKSGEFFAISPNGEYVAYIESNESGGEDRFRCYVFSASGGHREVGNDIIPIAVSDDGGLVYGTRFAQKNMEEPVLELWVIDDQRETRLGELRTTQLPTLAYNIDCNQILFDSDDGVFFSEDGNPPIRILEKAEQFFISFRLTNRPIQIEEWWITSFFTGTEDLFYIPLSVYSDKNTRSLLYLDENLKPNEIIENSGGFIQKDQSIISYSFDRQGLVIATDFSIEGTGTIETVVSTPPNVRYEISNDHSLFYWLPDERTMFKVQFDEDNEPQIMSEQCVGMVRASRNDKSDLIYYLQLSPTPDNPSDYTSIYYKDLYVIEDTPNAIPQLVSEKVGTLFAGEYGVYYLELESVASGIEKDFPNYCTGDIYDSNKLYFASDGETFQLIGTVEYKHYVAGG